MKPLMGLALLTTLFASAAADGRRQDIVVTEKQPITLAQWSQVVSKALERNIHYPRPMSGQMFPSGIVSVRFNCSEAGRPEKVTVSRKSGSRQLDLAAMRAVSAIKTLHPMPAKLRPTQQYEANILFATSWDDYYRQIKVLTKEAERRNAWFSDGDQTIALNVGFQPTRRM